MVSAVAIAPEELGIDLMDGTFYGRDPYEAYAWMRAHAPVYYDERNDLWAAASYATVKQASVDTESFSNGQGIRPKSAPLPMMIEFDAPEHVLRRRLVSEGFTPKRVRAMEDRLRLACDAIIDTVCAQGQCDFVADIAAPLPIAVIGDMLGFAPEDRAELLRWSDDMLKSQGSPDPDAMERAMEAFVGYSGYINPVLAQRRGDAGSDDLVGVLCHAEIDGHSPRRRLAGPRDLAYPHRRRRDDPSRHQRRDGGALGPPRPAGEPGGGPRRAHARCGRGDAPLGVSDQEHEPHRDDTTSSWEARPSAPDNRSFCCTRRPTATKRCSTTLKRSTSPERRTRTSHSGSARTSAWATNWPAWS